MISKTERAIHRGLMVTVLVVFLIMLAGLLFPVYGGHPPSPKTACLSNMKQLGLGVVLYTSDHDDALPVRDGPLPSAVGWGERIFPYVKGEFLFADGVERKDLPDEERSRPRVSYALNANVAAMPRASSESESAARSVLLYEVAGARTGRGGELHSTLRLSPTGDGAAGGLLDSTDPEVETLAVPATGPLANSGLDPNSPARHKGTSNFAFLDLHAKSLAPERVSAGANARTAKDAASLTGCRRPDLPGRDRPCAVGTGTIREYETNRATFSLR